jgi:hypothetical protein
VKSFLQKISVLIKSFWKNSPKWRKTLLNEDQESFVSAIRKTDPVFRLFESLSNRFIVLFFVSMLITFLFHMFAAWTAGMLHTKTFMFFSVNEILPFGHVIMFPTDLSKWQRALYLPIDKRIVENRIPVVGFFQNFTEFYFYFFSQPVGFAGLVWQPIAIAGVIHYFRKNKVIAGLTDEGKYRYQRDLSYDDQVGQLRKWLANPWLPKILWIILITVNLTYFYPYLRERFELFENFSLLEKLFYRELPSAMGWRQSMPPFSRPLELLAADFIYYSAITMGWRSVFFTVWIVRLFMYNHIKVHPTHDDGAGGLGSLGSFLSRTGYIIGIYGGFFLLSILTQQSTWLSDSPTIVYSLEGIYESLQSRGTLLPIYIVLAPTVYFLPIWFGHLAMERFKQQELSRISQAYDEYYMNTSSVIEKLSSADEKVFGNSEQKLKTNLSSINHLRELSEEVNSFPSWPTKRIYQVRYIGSTALGPILITLLQDQLLGLIQKLAKS